MHARLREITQNEVNNAFLEAQNGSNVLLSFTNHDFRNMAPEVIKIMNFIRTASRKFPNVQFFFEEAADGFRKCLNIQKSKAKLSLDLTKIHNQKWELKVQVSGDMFGPQPFLALKDKNGQYFWQNFDFVDDKNWNYIFDEDNAPIDIIEKIGVACNSNSGVPDVKILDISKEFNKSKNKNDL